MTKIVQLPIITLMCILLFVDGCNRQDLADLATTLANAIAVIAGLQGKPEVGQKLKADALLISQAVRTWKPGMPAGDIVRLINNLIRDLNTLPIDDKYRPFIIMALGTAAHMIDILTQNTGRPETSVRLVQPPSTAKEFREDWNAVRAATPDVEQAPILMK